jgi:Fe-S cluster biogenesis protein NfuA
MEKSSKPDTHLCLGWWEANEPVMNNGEFQTRTQQIERLLEQINTLDDESARLTAVELMQTLMDLHGAALCRIVEMLSNSGESNRSALRKISDDPLVCGLLVLYGIHPLSPQERVVRAVERIKPQLQKLGSTLELTTIDDNVVHLKLLGTRLDVHSATSARAMIEQAVRESVPEVAEVAIDGVPDSGFVPLTMIQPAISTTEEKQYEESTA